MTHASFADHPATWCGTSRLDLDVVRSGAERVISHADVEMNLRWIRIRIAEQTAAVMGRHEFRHWLTNPGKPLKADDITMVLRRGSASLTYQPSLFNEIRWPSLARLFERV